MNFLKLVRYKNLIIIALTMIMMRYFVMQPMLSRLGMELQLSAWLFIALIGATILIAAGGYVINDYFDTKTDLVNRPDTVIVGKSIGKRTAIAAHSILNVLGVALGTIVSFKVGKPIFSLLFIITTGILWFYSTTYKRQLLIGNIIVAILTGLVPLIPLIFEYPLFQVYWESIVIYNLKLYPMVYWVGGYAFFAFMLTLAREIIKDIEDFEGDATYGRNSIPIHYGINTSKYVISIILLATLAVLWFAISQYLKMQKELDFVTLIYSIIFITIPIFALITIVLMSKSKKDYHMASTVCKVVMLFGILYTVINKFMI